MFIKLYLIALVFISAALSVAAQKKEPIVKNEITVVSENDNYNFSKEDRYYTNGFFIKYNKLGKADESKSVKIIHRFEAGQKIYNPHYNRRNVASVLATMDRPYTAWLYAGYGQTKVTTKGNVLLFDINAGILGPAALGKQIQTGYHRIISLYKIYGWEYQLNNEPGINAGIRYYHLLLKNEDQNITIHALTNAMLGNTFTNASAGVLIKAGQLEKEANTSYWGSNLGISQSEKFFPEEIIIFLEPVITYQAYNATVQGGLFIKDKGPFVAPLSPLQFVIKGGAMFTYKKATFNIAYILKQREAKSMLTPAEVFGSFAIGYRF
jgi:lipid A 3-O-deacylase